MPVWKDCWDVPVRVTEERLAHVFEHPEMTSQEERIRQTLAEPEVVVHSLSDPEVRLYYRSYETAALRTKYLCAVVRWRQNGAFLVTAYFTDRPKRGAQPWPSR